MVLSPCGWACLLGIRWKRFNHEHELSSCEQSWCKGNWCMFYRGERNRSERDKSRQQQWHSLEAFETFRLPYNFTIAVYRSLDFIAGCYHLRCGDADLLSLLWNHQCLWIRTAKDINSPSSSVDANSCDCDGLFLSLWLVLFKRAATFSLLSTTWTEEKIVSSFLHSLLYRCYLPTYRITLQALGMSFSKLSLVQNIPKNINLLTSFGVQVYLLTKHFCTQSVKRQISLFCQMTVPLCLAFIIGMIFKYLIYPAYIKEDTNGKCCVV